MARATLLTAWILSVLPLFGPALWPDAVDLGGASVLGLVLLPWVSLAGLPRGAPGPRRPGELAPMLLALPPIVAALRLEALDGAAPAQLAILAGSGLALALLLAIAAQLARGGGAYHRYGLLWLVLVPGLPVLRAALWWATGPSPREPAPWLAALSEASPAAWVLASSAEGAPVTWPWPSAVAVAVLLLAAAPGRIGPGPEEEGIA